MISQQTRDRWKQQVGYLARNLKALNDWETGFIDELARRLNDGKDISMRQSMILSQTYERVTRKVG